MEHPVKILDHALKETWRSSVLYCMMLWSNHTDPEPIWVEEADFKEKYPYLLKTEVSS